MSSIRTYNYNRKTLTYVDIIVSTLDWMNRMLNAHSSPGQILGALKSSREHLFAGKRSPLVRDLAVVRWVNTRYGKPPSKKLGRYNNMKRKNIDYRGNPDTFAGQPV